MCRLLVESSAKTDFDFKPGDTVRVHVKVVEGNRERIQVSKEPSSAEGSAVPGDFTVRPPRIGVERVSRYTPVEKVEVVRRGKVRRAKLYYLRERVGKRARIKEKN